MEVSFYSTEDIINNVQWTQGEEIGYLKLAIKHVLPVNLEKVVVVEPDVIFTSNVAELWDLFRSFSPAQVI